MQPLKIKYDRHASTKYYPGSRIIDFKPNQIRRSVILIILENGKIEVASLKNGTINPEQSFQTNSENFLTAEWTQNDASRFLTSDSQDNLYMWDISKGITPAFSAQSKSGAILDMRQFAGRPETIITLTDKNNVQMQVNQLRHSSAEQ